MRSVARVVPVAAVACWASACYPFGGCESDRIEVSYPVSVQIGDLTESWDVSGRVYNSNVDDYSALVEAMIDGTRGTAGLVWTMDRGLGSRQGFLAFHLGPNVVEGQVIAPSYVFEGGGWGFLSPGQAVGVGLQVDDFVAATVEGSLRVLDVAPLRMEVDLTFGDGQGRVVTMTGVMSMERIRESVTCT